MPPRSTQQPESISKIPCTNNKQQWNKHCAPFLCKYCLQRFSSLDYHRRHRSTHEKIYRKYWLKKSVKEPQLRYWQTRYKLRNREKTIYGKKNEKVGEFMNIDEQELRIDMKESNKSNVRRRGRRKKMNLDGTKQRRGKKISYKCATCGKEYRLASVLKRHLKVHNPRPYRCNVCNKTFKFKYTLTSHMRLHSEKHRRKRHRCEVCRQTFRWRGYLNMHIRKCTGDKPLQCALCNERFCYKYKLEKHEKTHLGDVETEQSAPSTAATNNAGIIHPEVAEYRCDHCGAGFFLENDLTSHLRTAHMIQTMPKSILGDNFFLDDW